MICNDRLARTAVIGLGTPARVDLVRLSVCYVLGSITLAVVPIVLTPSTSDRYWLDICKTILSRVPE
jgi:hypothetical protein